MRRRYFYWTYLVTALVLTIYGGYSFFYNYFKGKNIPILGIIFFISGLVLLFLYLILFIISLIQKRNHKEEKMTTDDEYKIDFEESTEEEEVEEEEVKPVKNNTYRSDTTYERTSSYRSSSSSSRSYETIYIRKVGYGLVLRVTGLQILDMRTNIYYTIEGNIVNQNGSGPVFEISGNRIRSAFGSYLYEISGNNVNKTLGGFYASFSGNYLQIHDLSEKYEIDGDLSIKQKLAIVALLFGAY